MPRCHFGRLYALGILIAMELPLVDDGESLFETGEFTTTEAVGDEEERVSH